MATGGGAAGAQVCPLCNAVVDGGDQLQLHYLTSCSGYDLGQCVVSVCVCVCVCVCVRACVR